MECFLGFVVAAAGNTLAIPVWCCVVEFGDAVVMKMVCY